MLAIANNPGVPVRAMWQERPNEGEKRILPPPSLGRYGMSVNRFLKLESLLAQHHSISEAELDKTDPWRYCNLVIESHNKHWVEVYSPSWLLGPDESMAPWTADDGPRPQDIPFLSHVPRKPKDLGAEIKTTADGESGAIIRLELALKYKRLRGQAPCEAPFEAEHGATTAQCLRLVEPWLNTNRCFGADAHFISVKSAEVMLEHGLYAFGDLKQMSARYPLKELELYCGPVSGDWATMTTRLLGEHKVFAVAHRRGQAVRIFVWLGAHSFDLPLPTHTPAPPSTCRFIPTCQLMEQQSVGVTSHTRMTRGSMAT